MRKKNRKTNNILVREGINTIPFFTKRKTSADQVFFCPSGNWSMRRGNIKKLKQDETSDKRAKL